MPRYELAVIFRILERPELSKAIKRTCQAVMEKNGLVRSMENLGSRQLPYRMFKHGHQHWKGHYFIVDYDGPPDRMVELKDYLNRDLDIIRPNILRKEVEIERPCDHGPCYFGEMTDEIHTKLKHFKLVKPL